jgi:hypothetical protein
MGPVPRAITAEELNAWNREKNLEETARVPVTTLGNNQIITTR